MTVGKNHYYNLVKSVYKLLIRKVVYDCWQESLLQLGEIRVKIADSKGCILLLARIIITIR